MAQCSLNLENVADNHNEVQKVVKSARKDGKSEKQIREHLEKEDLLEYYLDEALGYTTRKVAKNNSNDSKYDSVRVHQIEDRGDSWEVLYTTDKKYEARVMVVDKVYGATKNGGSSLHTVDLYRMFEEQQTKKELEYNDLYDEVRETALEDGATENEATLLGASKKDKKNAKKNNKSRFTEKANLLHDEEKMLEFAEEVDAAAVNKAGDRKAELLEELRTVLTGDGRYLPKDLRFFIARTTQKTGVIFKPHSDRKMKAGIHMTQGTKKGRGTEYQSDLEKLVHDVTHAATYYALNSKRPEVSAIRRKLTKAYDLVMDNISIEGLVGKEASAADKRNAQDLIDHLRSEEGLDEFVALVRSNKMLGDFAKKQTLKYKNPEAKTVWEMVKNVLKDIFAMMGAIVGKDIGDQTAYNLVFEMSDKLMEINNRTDEEVKRNKLMNVIGDTWDAANRKTADAIEAVFSKATGETSYIEPLPADAGKLESIKYVMVGMLKLLSDERTRPYMYTALDKISPFVGYDSIFQKVIKSTLSKDDMTSTVENLVLASRRIDQQMDKVHLNTTVAVQNLFNGELREKDSTMLTEVLLELDIQALHNKYDVFKLLRSPSAVQTEVDKLESMLKDKYSKDSTYYINEAKMLADYMRTGNGNELLNFNAHTIARKFGTEDVKGKVSKELEDSIDELTSLYAMQEISFADRERVIELEEKYEGSINNLLKIQQGFVESSKVGRFKNDPYNMIKGYVKEINDSEVEIEVAPVSEELMMEQKGYTLVGPVADNDMNLLIEPLGIYKREGFGLNQFTRYAFRTTKNHRKGTALEDILYSQTDLGKSLVDARTKQVVKKIQGKASKKLSHISNKLGVDEAYNNNIVPVYDQFGKVKTYRAVMSKELKKRLLNPDKRVALTMGEMMAAHVNHAETLNMNRKVADILIKDAAENINETNKSAGSVYGDNGYEYIEIGPLVDNEHKEKWMMLPEDVRYYLSTEWMKKGNKKDSPIYVRKDLLKMYFGQRDFSIADTKGVQMLPHRMQYYIKQLENIWIKIAQIAKVHMIIKTPAVWIGNIFSNVVLLMRDGWNISEITKMHLDAMADLEEYQKIAKEIVDLERRLMTASARKDRNGVKKLKGIIAAKKGLLAKNAASPLIDKGLFSSIVEDTTPEERKMESKAEKLIGKAAQFVPNWLQWAVKYSLLTEDTAVYKMFLKVTQLGDFLGRYTKYHLMMKKMGNEYREKYGVDPSSAVLTRMSMAAGNASRDMFVNYNNPDNDMLMYLNRIMVVGFSRFFFGTQRVNIEMVKDKPLNAIADIFLQNAVVDYEDISEHTFLTKNYGALIYSPFEVLDQAFSFMGYDLITGNAVNAFDGLVKVKALN